MLCGVCLLLCLNLLVKDANQTVCCTNPNFCRSQLNPAHVLALVSGGQVYVWVGAKSGGYSEASLKPLYSQAGVASGEGQVQVFKEHLEPPLFMAQFAGE
jgi:hypothetical protein